MTAISTRRTCSRTRGFTLIELLVTLVIIALLAGLATLSVGGRAHRQARDEAQRLYQILDYGSDEATLQGEELGVRFAQGSYSFLRFDQGEDHWVPVAERPFAPHDLPQSVSMELRLDDNDVRIDSQSGGEERTPEILLLSSGEISAFRIEFRSSDGPDVASVISSDGGGALALE